MPDTVGEAFVALRVDERQVSADMTKATTSGVKTAATAAAGLLAGYGIKSFLSGVNQEAREAQKVGAQTEAVLKSTGNAAKISADEIGELSAALSKKSAVDDEVIQSGANMLLTFKNIRNEQGKGNDIFNQTTEAVLDMAAGMAAASGGEVDLKGASIQLGKALNDPIAGISALTRVGVQFTDQQKKKIASLVDEGKVLEAQKIILAEVNAQFAGSAAANATDADKATVAIGNFKESIGTLLLPVLNEGAQALTAMADGFNSLPGPLQSVATYGVLAVGALAGIAKITNIGKDIGTTLKPALDKIIGTKGGAAGGGSGLLGMGGAAAAWAAGAALIGGTAVGLSRTISGEAYKIDLDLAELANTTDKQLTKMFGALTKVDSQLSKQLFKQVLSSDPVLAERLLNSLDAAGEKTGWYRTQLDYATGALDRNKVSGDKHKQGLDETGGAYDTTNTKIQEQIDLLDKRQQKIDGQVNADLRAQTAALDLNDALQAQYDAFIIAASAGGQNDEANEALARQTIATKQAILEQAQAVGDQTAATYGSVAGSLAYKEELIRLAATMAPGNPLRVFIEELIAKQDEAGKDRKFTITGDASQAIGELDALAAAWVRATPAALGLAALGGGQFISPDAQSGLDLSFLTDPSNPIVQDFLRSLSGRASGGPVGPGSWIVGEQGPEMLTLGANGRGYVTDAATTAKMGAGIMVNVTTAERISDTTRFGIDLMRKLELVQSEYAL